MKITGRQRAYLSKKAHDLHPYVMVGGDGLTSAVIKAVEEALESHELIKVKFQDHKSARRELAPEMAVKTDALLVKIIGNVAVLFRTARDPEKRTISLP
ncbi:MAG: YhbY family RNA-binding protein [Spirochaetales bacterium]|nr:YhbY family RNA-binding protein [Spirochaetales bacterium]